MRVQITEILFDEALQTYTVSFSTPFGVGWGKWRGEQPEMYGYYDVDLDVAPIFTWGENINVVEDDRFIIDDVDETLTIQGKLEVVEPDGAIYLRLGGSLVLMETEGEAPDLDVFVRAHPDLIGLFPRED